MSVMYAYVIVGVSVCVIMYDPFLVVLLYLSILEAFTNVQLEFECKFGIVKLTTRILKSSSKKKDFFVRRLTFSF